MASSATSLVEGVMISGIVTCYLYQPHVRKAFGQGV
jgi:hypothetical protein